MPSRELIAVSGVEGCGKSFILSEYKRCRSDFIRFSEIARMMFPINQAVLRQTNDKLSHQALTGYLTNHQTIAENKMTKAIFDRCILDPLTYQALYAPDEQVDLNGLQQYITDFNDANEQDYLLDTVILLNHPKNEDFITNSIFTDTARLYSGDVDKYLSDAKRFESHYVEFFNLLKGVAPVLTRIDSFSENPDVVNECLNAGSLQLDACA